MSRGLLLRQGSSRAREPAGSWQLWGKLLRKNQVYIKNVGDSRGREDRLRSLLNHREQSLPDQERRSLQRLRAASAVAEQAVAVQLPAPGSDSMLASLLKGLPCSRNSKSCCNALSVLHRALCSRTHSFLRNRSRL